MTNYQIIHQQALRAARLYKKSQHELLLAIQLVDSKRVFLKVGYKNLYDYCMKCLLLSEGTTYALIRVARKSVEIPEIEQAIAQGTLSLSHAKTLLPVIKKENKTEWLEKAKSMSVRNLEKEVAQTKPELLIREQLKVVAENRVKLECGLSPKALEIIERAKALLAQKTGKPINLEAAIELVFSDYLKRHDPLLKQERVATCPQNATKFPKWKDPNQREAHGPKSQNLPASIKRQVLQRDQGRCQAKDPSGILCGQSLWIDVHHQIPVSKGGTHELPNLITLCRDHHRLWHLNN